MVDQNASMARGTLVSLHTTILGMDGPRQITSWKYTMRFRRTGAAYHRPNGNTIDWKWLEPPCTSPTVNMHGAGPRKASNGVDREKMDFGSTPTSKNILSSHKKFHGTMNCRQQRNDFSNRQAARFSIIFCVASTSHGDWGLHSYSNQLIRNCAGRKKELPNTKQATATPLMRLIGSRFFTSSKSTSRFSQNSRVSMWAPKPSAKARRKTSNELAK